VRRFGVAEYIKKYLNRHFDFLICDEAHEMKGGNTAQGNAFGALASACKKVITLTGTVVGGYADDIFYILYRISPHTMKDEDIEYKKVSNWIARYGVLETVTRYSSEDNICSRGKKMSSNIRRKPGISPLVFSQHLMEKTAFLHLSDISSSLPPITEEVVICRMDPDLKESYSELEEDLKRAVREALARGSKALLGTYLNTLLSYPDRPFDNEVIKDPQIKDKVIAMPRELSKKFIYAKERELIDLITKEAREGRKVFVYCQYTATRDVTMRLKNLLSEAGFRAEVMKSTVNPEKREEWVKQQVKSGTQVIIANPKLVQTGLDLYDFPTLVFFQTGYSVFTLRQASRRSWRIGQKKPVRIYYLFYKDTMQERAMELMGKKMEASLAIEGKFSEEGLLAMTSGEDMTTALAKTLVEGLNNEGAENIWQKLNEKNSVYKSEEWIDDHQKEQEAEKVIDDVISVVPDAERVVYMDFLAYGKRNGKVKKRVAVRTDEIESAPDQEEGHIQFSMFE
jgi:SNF2 family DNA or RNA helicase